jgi:hypothetical protein
MNMFQLSYGESPPTKIVSAAGKISSLATGILEEEIRWNIKT